MVGMGISFAMDQVAWQILPPENIAVLRSFLAASVSRKLALEHLSKDDVVMSSHEYRICL